MRSLIIIQALLLPSIWALSIQNSSKHMLSRRDAFVSVLTSTTTIAVTLTQLPQNSMAIGEDDIPEKIDLLNKISNKSRSEEDIARAIARLVPLDPSKGRAATLDEIGGKWELIYSINAEAFSPLLNLPKIIRPTSYQLLGDDAAPVVGGGRIAQLLNFPLIPLSYILSSGAVPVESDPSTLEIFPPFRFEIELAGAKFQVVESKSDADFRAVNSRTEEAQRAGRNLYKQRYLDTTGKKGDIRISEVIAGDPVLVGCVFVHRRI